MRVFTRVADLNSFHLAAKQLGMSTSAVTRSVGMLEAYLNMRLLNRTTRSLPLTEIGKNYLNGCREIIGTLEEMESNLMHSTRDPSGKLRIAAPMAFVASDLGALLASYRTLHPRIDFDVTTFDTHINMVEGGYDVCFSDDRRLTSATLVSRGLTSIDELVVASPVYLAQHGTPCDRSELSAHSLLAVSDGSPRRWEFADANGVYRVFTGHGVSTTANMMVRMTALNHIGIALLTAPFVSDDLARGTLVRVLEQFKVNGGPREISIVYSGRNNLSSKIRNFIEFTVRQYRAPDMTVSSCAAVSPSGLRTWKKY
jgi:DNA-binding transcriptional LysR family regulator